MDFHRFPWISTDSTDLHWFPWISMDFPGFPWISTESMDIHGYQWNPFISMGFHGIFGFPWISIDFHSIPGNPWNPWISCRFPLIDFRRFSVYFPLIFEIRLPLTVRNLLVRLSCVLTATGKRTEAYRLAANGNCKHPWNRSCLLPRLRSCRPPI